MNEKEFLDLINEHQGIIHKTCRVYRDSKEDQEDLFQEIIFQLWKSLSTFNGDSKFSSWMYRIALNTAMVAFRKQRINITYPEIMPDRAEEQHDENEAYQKERLFDVIKKLDAAEKALIMLYFEGLSYKEIAEVLGVSENYIGVKLNRVKVKIQKLLKD